jgi:septal ring-binding cell division protein DamX
LPDATRLAATAVPERAVAEPARADVPEAPAVDPYTAAATQAGPVSAERRPEAAAGGGAAVTRAAPGKEAGKESGKESTYLIRRLAATEEWLKTADASRYSIQLMHIGIDRGGGLEASLRHSGLGADLDRVWVYRTRIRGEGLLSVLLGEYPSQEDARRVLEGLPPALRQPRPFVRSVRDVRAGGAGADG